MARVKADVTAEKISTPAEQAATTPRPKRYLWAGVAGAALLSAAAVYVVANVFEKSPISTATIDFTTPGGKVRSVVSRTELGRKNNTVIEEAVEGAEADVGEEAPTEVAIVGNNISVAEPLERAEQNLNQLGQVIGQLTALEERIIALDAQLAAAKQHRQQAPDLSAVRQQLAATRLGLAFAGGANLADALADAKNQLATPAAQALLAQLEVLTAEGVITPLSLYRQATAAQKLLPPRAEAEAVDEGNLSLWQRVRLMLSRWIDVRPISGAAEVWPAQLEKVVVALSFADVAQAEQLLTATPLVDDSRLEALRQNVQRYQVQRRLVWQLQQAEAVTEAM